MARPRNTESDAAILADASDTLREGGYDALVVDDLARRVGVAKTTVYRRWPTKNHLVAGAIASWRGETPVPGGGSLEDDLVVLVTDLAEFVDSAPMRRMIAELVAAAVREPELRPHVDALWRERRDALGRLLGAGSGVADQLLGAVFYRAIVSHEPLDGEFAAALVRSTLAGARPQ
jgi:AcrR family transcriptional regulator